MKLSEVKANMHKDVLYEGSVYYLEKCEMWLDENAKEFKYSLVLIDNKNRVFHIPIEKAEVINNVRK